MRKFTAAVMIGIMAVSLTACGKEVDLKKVNATKVAGTEDLWWFCDGTTLIYIEKWQGDDEYVAFFSWGCDDKGKPTKELPGTPGDHNGGDTGNGDK